MAEALDEFVKTTVKTHSPGWRKGRKNKKQEPETAISASSKKIAQREAHTDSKNGSSACGLRQSGPEVGRTFEKPLKSPSQVTLQVYDVTWFTQWAQLPVYHLGVEVYNLEYSFGSEGVQCCSPGCYESRSHRKSIALGVTRLSFSAVHLALQSMALNTWQPQTYALLSRNCQSFAVDFCRVLGVSIPQEFCRFSEPLMSATSPLLCSVGDPTPSATNDFADQSPRIPPVLHDDLLRNHSVAPGAPGNFSGALQDYGALVATAEYNISTRQMTAEEDLGVLAQPLAYAIKHGGTAVVADNTTSIHTHKVAMRTSL